MFVFHVCKFSMFCHVCFTRSTSVDSYSDVEKAGTRHQHTDEMSRTE
uniref:Uncharacterized protein n=1 Tax=Anguilla anguilla TaxID=7936 RepID=A0A0E9VK96_ANGAN